MQKICEFAKNMRAYVLRKCDLHCSKEATKLPLHCGLPSRGRELLGVRVRVRVRVATKLGVGLLAARPRRRITPRIDLDHRQLLILMPNMSFLGKTCHFAPYRTIPHHTARSRALRKVGVCRGSELKGLILDVESALESIPTIASYSI